VDRDGLTDIVCRNFEFFNPDSIRDIVMILESRILTAIQAQ